MRKKISSIRKQKNSGHLPRIILKVLIVVLLVILLSGSIVIIARNPIGKIITEKVLHEYFDVPVTVKNIQIGITTSEIRMEGVSIGNVAYRVSPLITIGDIIVKYRITPTFNKKIFYISDLRMDDVVLFMHAHTRAITTGITNTSQDISQDAEAGESSPTNNMRDNIVRAINVDEAIHLMPLMKKFESVSQHIDQLDISASESIDTLSKRLTNIQHKYRSIQSIIQTEPELSTLQYTIHDIQNLLLQTKDIARSITQIKNNSGVHAAQLSTLAQGINDEGLQVDINTIIDTQNNLWEIARVMSRHTIHNIIRKEIEQYQGAGYKIMGGINNMLSAFMSSETAYPIYIHPLRVTIILQEFISFQVELPVMTLGVWESFAPVHFRIRSPKKKPAKTEPAKTEPAKTEPAKTEPAKTEPAKKEQAKKEQAKKEQAVLAKTEQPKTEPEKKEQAVLEEVGEGGGNIIFSPYAQNMLTLTFDFTHIPFTLTNPFLSQLYLREIAGQLSGSYQITFASNRDSHIEGNSYLDIRSATEISPSDFASYLASEVVSHNPIHISFVADMEKDNLITLNTASDDFENMGAIFSDMVRNEIIQQEAYITQQFATSMTKSISDTLQIYYEMIDNMLYAANEQEERLSILQGKIQDLQKSTQKKIIETTKLHTRNKIKAQVDSIRNKKPF